jgi:hypothetical protein
MDNSICPTPVVLFIGSGLCRATESDFRVIPNNKDTLQCSLPAKRGHGKSSAPRRMVKGCGLNCRRRASSRSAALDPKLELNYSTNTVNRGVVEGVYYKLLSTFPALGRWLSCAIDLIFTKAL